MKRKIEPTTIINSKDNTSYKTVIREMVKEKIERSDRSKKILIDEIEDVTKGKTINIEVKKGNLIFN